MMGCGGVRPVKASPSGGLRPALTGLVGGLLVRRSARCRGSRRPPGLASA